jgi:hypothetical protein
MKGVKVMQDEKEVHAERARMAKSIIKNIVETNLIEFENIEMYNLIPIGNIFSSLGEPAIVLDDQRQKVDLKLSIKVINTLSAIQDLPLLQEKIIEEIRAFTGMEEVNVDFMIRKFIIHKKNQTHV